MHLSVLMVKEMIRMKTITQSHWNNLMHKLSTDKGMDNDSAYNWMRKNFNIKKSSSQSLFNDDTYKI